MIIYWIDKSIPKILELEVEVQADGSLKCADGSIFAGKHYKDRNKAITALIDIVNKMRDKCRKDIDDAKLKLKRLQDIDTHWRGQIITPNGKNKLKHENH